MAKRYAGADSGIEAGDDDPDAVRAKILRHRPRALAFVGKRAATVFLGRAPAYGRQEETVGETVLWVLPSPSGAARRYWSQAPWQALADHVRHRLGRVSR